MTLCQQFFLTHLLKVSLHGSLSLSLNASTFDHVSNEIHCLVLEPIVLFIKGFDILVWVKKDIGEKCL